MAAVFKLGDRIGEIDAQLRELDRSADSVFGLLGGMPARLSVPRIQRYRDRLNALEAAALAQVIDDKGDTKVAENIVGKSGKVSKRSKKAAVARAKLGKKNPSITDKMATGELTDEQVDVIADTDRKTDGAAGSDDSFITDIANAGIDQSRSVAADFITDNADADGTQSEYDRQRLLRKANKFTTDRRTDAIMFEGDTAAISEIWSAANRRADEFYRDDGGRDLAVNRHPRTNEQRLFDALIDIFKNGTCGGGCGHGDGDSTSSADNDNESAERHGRGGCATLGTETAYNDGSASNPTSATRSKRYTPKVTSSRPTIVVGVTLDKFLGLDPNSAAELIGTGPIADTVLAEYVGNANIIAMLFGHRGQPLWMSRQVRLATHAQHVALVIRDKRCILCGADHTKCKAHHITPWSAPAQGETDITKLVLVCDSCHHYIHDEHQTVYQDAATGRWMLRPALPHEIAPSRPPKPSRSEAPQRK